jgi:hypothetical protein
MELLEITIEIINPQTGNTVKLISQFYLLINYYGLEIRFQLGYQVTKRYKYVEELVFLLESFLSFG